MSIQQTNMCNIPGYIPEIDYNDNFGYPLCSQYNFLHTENGHYDGTKEIGFYNDHESVTEEYWSTLVCVWRVKDTKPNKSTNQ